MRKVALVTGGNKGIGFETARQLSVLGMDVWIGCRDEARGGEAQARLESEGIDVRYIQFDVTDDASVSAAGARIEDEMGRLDVLINNAGLFGDNAAPSQVSFQILRQTFETNFFGAIRVMQRFVPLLIKSGAGRVVNVSSGLGSITQQCDPNWEFAKAKALAYTSSKAALNMATVIFAAELRQASIKVNAADPGYTATDMNEYRGYRTVKQAGELIVRLATLPTDGPTGGFFDESGVVPW